MIDIRLTTAQDLPAILAIYNEAILTTTAVYDYHPHTLAMRQAWYDAKVAAGWPVFVAEDAGGVVGFLGRWLDLKFLELLLERPGKPRE